MLVLTYIDLLTHFLQQALLKRLGYSGALKPFCLAVSADFTLVLPGIQKDSCSPSQTQSINTARHLQLWWLSNCQRKVQFQ